jgi:hypothetical protein
MSVLKAVQLNQRGLRYGRRISIVVRGAAFYGSLRRRGRLHARSRCGYGLTTLKAARQPRTDRSMVFCYAKPGFWLNCSRSVNLSPDSISVAFTAKAAGQV